MNIELKITTRKRVTGLTALVAALPPRAATGKPWSLTTVGRVLTGEREPSPELRGALSALNVEIPAK